MKEQFTLTSIPELGTKLNEDVISAIKTGIESKNYSKANLAKDLDISRAALYKKLGQKSRWKTQELKIIFEKLNINYSSDIIKEASPLRNSQIGELVTLISQMTEKQVNILLKNIKSGIALIEEPEWLRDTTPEARKAIEDYAQYPLLRNTDKSPKLEK